MFESKETAGLNTYYCLLSGEIQNINVCINKDEILLFFCYFYRVTCPSSLFWYILFLSLQKIDNFTQTKKKIFLVFSSIRETQ